jgi:predicted nucleic acid-binding protein
MQKKLKEFNEKDPIFIDANIFLHHAFDSNPISIQFLKAALLKAKEYGLVMADASHIAVMERKGISHMASSDGDFSSVKNITLWSPN